MLVVLKVVIDGFTGTYYPQLMEFQALSMYSFVQFNQISIVVIFLKRKTTCDLGGNALKILSIIKLSVGMIRDLFFIDFFLFSFPNNYILLSLLAKIKQLNKVIDDLIVVHWRYSILIVNLVFYHKLPVVGQSQSSLNLGLPV